MSAVRNTNPSGTRSGRLQQRPVNGRKNTAVSSDPTSSPWRAIHRDWANPGQAVSSHRLGVWAPKITVLNRYPADLGGPATLGTSQRP